MSSLAHVEMWIWYCLLSLCTLICMPKPAAKVERGRRNLLRRLPEFETTWQLFTHVPSSAYDGMLWGDTVVQHIPQWDPDKFKCGYRSGDVFFCEWGHWDMNASQSWMHHRGIQFLGIYLHALKLCLPNIMMVQAPRKDKADRIFQFFVTCETQ